MSGSGMPKDDAGLDPCDWCGGPIKQPATGRRRRYCRHSHRELAYRERRTQRRIGEAVRAVENPPPSVPSVDETRPDPVPSVDETRRVPPLRWSGLFMPAPLLPDRE
jgi:hypothetical protein